MTKTEMIDTYLRKIGIRRLQGETLEPLMPFLLGDAIYQIFNEDIAHLDLRHELKKIRNDWVNAYGRLNGLFFRAFTTEQSIEVTDLMDDFEAYIHNDLMVLRCQVMQILGDEIGFEDKKVITSALLCHVLAQAAQCVWKDVYKVRVPKPGGRYEEIGMPNPWLEGINRAAFLLGTKLHTKVSDRYIDPNKCDGVPPAVQALCRRIYGWLKVTDNKTEQ